MKTQQTSDDCQEMQTNTGLTPDFYVSIHLEEDWQRSIGCQGEEYDEWAEDVERGMKKDVEKFLEEHPLVDRWDIAFDGTRDEVEVCWCGGRPTAESITAEEDMKREFEWELRLFWVYYIR